MNVALGCGIALSAPAVIGMVTYVNRAWAGKETVADHAADMRTLRTERAASIDSVRTVIDGRFAAQDDRMTFMSYLLCEQSQTQALTNDARKRCDTIIAKRMDPQ